MSDQYIGEIRMFTGNYPPVGWAFCDGQLLSISDYQTLFALIGTTYGGDGISKFALPDLRGRVSVGQGVNPSTGTTFTAGQKAGIEEVTLTVSELPNHTHLVSATSNTGTIPGPGNAIWAKNITQYASSPSTDTMDSEAITTVGGSQPHENMMPFLTVSFIIALNGVWPNRD